MKGTVKIDTKTSPPKDITHGRECCKKGINDRHKGYIGIVASHYIINNPINPYETISLMECHKGFLLLLLTFWFHLHNCSFHQDLVKSLLNCASGEPGIRCKMLDSGRVL